MNGAPYKISDHKCATCAYWQGRWDRLEFVGTRLQKVIAIGAAAGCLGNPGDKGGKTPGNRCNKWKLHPTLDKGK